MKILETDLIFCCEFEYSLTEQGETYSIACCCF